MQRFYNYLGKNSDSITIFTVLICVLIIQISTYVFKNEYRCNFNWYVSLSGCTVIWFSSFCIVEEKQNEKEKWNLK